MSSESYVISEDSNGAIVVTLDQVVINSIPGGIAETLTDLIPQRTFTHIESARFFTCDNGTEHGYYLTETNQYVGPHISGVRLPLTHATTQAHVQARNDSLSWIVPVTGERSVITFYDSDPGAQSTGTQNPAITSSMIVSPNGWQANQTEDSYGSTSYQVSALQTSGGFDSNTADGLFLPARTPNVWLNIYLPSVANVYTALYTAPANMYWRLMHYEVMYDSPSGSPYYTFKDNTAQRWGNRSMPHLSGTYASSGPINLPGAGMKSTTTADTLSIYCGNGGATALYGTVGLYVGP